MENQSIREPAVAGSFYPGDPVALSKMIADFFSRASKKDLPWEIAGLVSPHAGYIYSGHVAAEGYKLLEGLSYDTVAVISPSHAVAFDGVSVFPGRGYRTPLGTVEIDQELVDEISTDSKAVFADGIGHASAGFRGEHALEVQLPFLQTAIDRFKLLPLVMGGQQYSTCIGLADDLYRVLKDRNALIVASTDLSHFHSSGEAKRLDDKFIGGFENYDPEGLSKMLSMHECEACGGYPVIALMLYASKLGKPRAKALKYADSSATSGDRSSVVGYLSGVITVDR